MKLTAKEYSISLIPMTPLTPEEQLDIVMASQCHICERLFENEDERDRNHYHFSGVFKRKAHHHCNFDYRVP